MTDKIKFYADKLCRIPIDKIGWDQNVKFRLVTGEEIVIPNSVQTGDEFATATIYVRNEEKSRYGITELSHPDKRVKIAVQTAWLLPNSPVKLQIKFKVPENPNPENVIAAGEIKIKGYFIQRR